MMNHARRKYILLGFVAVAAFLLVALPFAGMSLISVPAVLNPALSPVDYEIFWRLRVPRLLTAYMAGGALALCGMVFQAMFRNALAEPYTLGVASGASLGAALYIQLGFSFTVLGFSGTGVFAFCGALITIVVVYGLTRIKKGFSVTTMLLAGVSLSFFFSSIIMFLQYISDFTSSFRIVRWLMGSLDVNGFEAFFNLAPFVVLGLAVVLWLALDLNMLATGDELALSRGVSVGRTKNILFLTTSLLVGAVVSVCGPIGFVGMMSPHICRLVIGNDHRYLAPASFLFGGFFLALCDTVARMVIAPAEIPVGVITAVLGCPFFLWLLLSNKHPY